MRLIKLLQKKYALSGKGANDLVKASLVCTLYDLILMFPVGLLYFLVDDIMDGNINNSLVPLYWLGVVVCLLVIGITTGWQYKATYFNTYIESGVRRVSLAKRLRLMPLSFFGKKDLADLTSTIMDDCQKIETASSHWLPQLYASFISTIIIGVSLFFFDWRMTIACLWVLPCSFFLVGFSYKFQNYLEHKQTKAKMECADGIQECIETVRDLKSNNAVNNYLKGLDNKIKMVEKRAIVTELGLACFVVTSQMLLRIGIATTVLTGAVLLADGSLSLMVFFMFLLVVSRLYDPMMAALQNLAAVISTNVQSERMNEILQSPLQNGSSTMDNKGFDICFNDVSFGYEKSAKILDGVSFTAKQGEVTALIGPSGGGKTTTMRLMTRFWDSDSGKISIGGMDISKIDPETLMSLYSIVFQDVTLFNNTVMENIRLGRKDATDEEVIKAAKLANCYEFVERMPKKWNTFIGENGSELSGGERQRISIARAFLKNAPIILLDEATASLDVDNETMIQESLSHLIKNKTVLIIAHRMRTVMGADNIVVLKDGKVAENDKIDNLLQCNSIFNNMLKKQMQTQLWNI